MRVLNSQQMREADRKTIDDLGLASLVLMENAGRQVVASIESAFSALPEMDVAVLCGRGSNGGDGFVVARVLGERGVAVRVFVLGQATDVRGDAKTNLDILRKLDVDIVEIADAAAWELRGSELMSADLIVDALFGTGLSGPIHGLAETVVADINASSRPVVAIDLPSGLSADSCEVPGPAIEATMTIALGAPKIPHVLPPAEEHVGDLVIADIGIPRGIVDGIDGRVIEILTRDAMRPLVTPRSADSHKGDFGRVVIVAGSPGRAGAASLAAMAALRSGAGLVTVAAPRSVAATIAALGAEYMVEALDEDAGGALTARAVDAVLAIRADVMAIGPGLGCHPETAKAIRSIVERAGVPVVIDADAINAYVGTADALVGRDGTDLIITPHPGEMARLMGLTIDDVQAHRLDVAIDFATTHRIHVVLKGHRTIVAAPDGRAAINLTGNPGMATAGSGDVLTGVVAAWCGQLLDPEAATRLGVYLHGLAGDLAAADEGEIALIAGDVVTHLGDAVLELTAKRKARAEES